MITQSVPLMIFVLLMSYHSVAAQNIAIALPGRDVELLCDVTGAGATAWRISGTIHLLSKLFTGAVAGHNISGRNIIVEDIMMNDVRNGSQYQCEILQNPPDPNIEGNVTILYVTGVPSVIPNVAISDFPYRLQWGEPFNNFDPILSYTVSCSGDDSCPPDFTTTDSTTRSYTITNLTAMTNYTFSVVATNSIGSGEAGVVMIATSSVPSVINAAPMLVCTPAVSELYNITVTCTIHPDSTADQCVVMAMADDGDTIAGIAAISKGMATVVINDLQCGVTYNITAEGMLNETLVGSRSSHGSIAPRPCPMILTADESDDELSIGAAIAITFTTTFIITLVVTALISIFFTSLYYKHWYKLKEKVTVYDDSTKQKDPYGDSITMDTDPAYATIAIIKMDTNPAYATTSH